MNDAPDDEFVELLPPPAWPHEGTEILFDRRVDCLVQAPLMVEIADDIHERICDDHKSRLSQLEHNAAELREKLEWSF